MNKKSYYVINLALLTGLLGTITTPLFAQSATEQATKFTLPQSLPSSVKEINIDGSKSMESVNSKLAERFKQKFSGVEVKPTYTSSESGIKSVLDGKADIAAIGRPLSNSEKGKGLKINQIGVEKIAIIVGKDNPFNKNITLDQFAKIYRGDIKDWSQIGGSKGAIKVIDRPDTSDTRQSFSRYPIFKSGVKTGSNAVKVQDDIKDVVAKLGKDGISYAPVSQIKDQPVTSIPLNNVKPDNPKYPFSQPFAYVHKGDKTTEGGKAFLGLASDKIGQEAIASSGLIPTNPNISSNTTTTSPEASTTVSSPNTANSSITSTKTDTNTANNATATDTQGQGGFPWWLLPIVALGGGVAWWLLGGKKDQKKADEPEASAQLKPLYPPTNRPSRPDGLPLTGDLSGTLGNIPTKSGDLTGNLKLGGLPTENLTPPTAKIDSPNVDLPKVEPPNDFSGTLDLSAPKAGDLSIDNPLDGIKDKASDLMKGAGIAGGAAIAGGLGIAASAKSLFDENKPDIKLPDVGLPDVNLPDAKLPDVNLPNAKLPDVGLPDVNLPDVGLPDANLPDAKLPDINLPDVGLPDINLPDAKLPDAKLPDVNLPDVGLPDVNLPDAKLPDVSLPDVGLPDVNLPDFGLPDIKLPDTQLPNPLTGLKDQAGGLIAGGSAILGGSVLLGGLGQKDETPTNSEDLSTELNFETPELKSPVEEISANLPTIPDPFGEVETPTLPTQEIPELPSLDNFADPFGEVDTATLPTQEISELPSLDNFADPFGEVETPTLPTEEIPELPSLDNTGDLMAGLDEFLKENDDLTSQESASISNNPFDQIPSFENGTDNPLISLKDKAADFIPEGLSNSLGDIKDKAADVLPSDLKDKASDFLKDAGGMGGAAVAGGLGMAAGAGQALQSFFNKEGDKDKGNESSPFSEGHITLESDKTAQAYAHWDIPAKLKSKLREQGGKKLALRLYDVTDRDINTELPPHCQEFECDPFSLDLRFTVPTIDRHYLVEIGYLTDDNQWLMLARSTPVLIRSV